MTKDERIILTSFVWMKIVGGEFPELLNDRNSCEFYNISDTLKLAKQKIKNVKEEENTINECFVYSITFANSRHTTAKMSKESEKRIMKQDIDLFSKELITMQDIEGRFQFNQLEGIKDILLDLNKYLQNFDDDLLLYLKLI